MTVTASRLTVPELARMMQAAIRDKTYQSQTRLGGAVARFLAWKKREASARTLEIYEGYLAALCVFYAAVDPDIHDVTSQMLLDAATQHPDGSYRVVRTAYREFFDWAEEWESLVRNPAKRLPKARKPAEKIYDVFSAAERAQIVKATDAMPLPWVQRLRALCFVDLGVRKDEARGLRPADFDTVAKVVVVKGKGEKERVVPFGDELWRAFVSYRNRPIPNVRMEDERGKYREDRPPLDTDYLFFPLGYVKATGAVTWADPFRQLAPRSMHSWWENLFAHAGARYRSMHMARHTVGTDLASADADAFTIRDWLGHADVSTTQTYVHNSRSRLNRGRGRLDEYRKAQGE